MGDAQPQVQAVWFVNRLVIEDEQLDVGIAQGIDGRAGLGDGAGIICATNRNQLQQCLWVAQVVDVFDGLAVDPLLVPGGQQDGKGEAWLPVHGGRVVEPGMFWFLPDEEAQPDIEEGLSRHHGDEQEKEDFKDMAKRGKKHTEFLSSIRQGYC